MHDRKIGPLKVSALGLGCMNLSGGYGRGEDDPAAIRLLNEALDCGYRFFDTATLYGDGHNEGLIGQALARRRQEFVLASKCGLARDADANNRIDGRPATLRAQCEASLKRLRTDWIDLYYLHRKDPQVPIEESVGALADLRSEGKIRCIGLSEVASDTLALAAKETKIDALQSEYSLWTRNPETKILASCEALDVAFVAFSPLGRGFLAGRNETVDDVALDDIRATIARPRFEAQAFAHNRQAFAKFNAVAIDLNCTPSSLALAWLLAQQNGRAQPNIIPIPGTKKIERMRENAAAIQLKLSAETTQLLNQIFNPSNIRGKRYIDSVLKSTDSEREQ